MKIKSLLASLVIGAGLTASSLFANSVQIFSNGGEELKAVTSENGTFLTFCLERDVIVYFGDHAYTYTIDGNAIKYAGGHPANLTLTSGSAWLYEAFRNGTLNDAFDGIGNYSDNRISNSFVLQDAFWILQSELILGNPLSNFYVNLAVSNLGAGAWAANSDNKVQVMNIWGTDGKDVQSQLYLVPDGGATTALLGLGLLSLAFFRRKL